MKITMLIPNNYRRRIAPRYFIALICLAQASIAAEINYDTLNFSDLSTGSYNLPTLDLDCTNFSPTRTYDFNAHWPAANRGNGLPTRAVVILDQVYNTIEPNSMWTNSTAISSAGNAAITIDSPGKYILTGDLQINAKVSGDAGSGVIGIAITCSNVTLDLNGYTISQASGSVAAGVTGVVGIYVKNSGTSLYNITIQNGQLNNIGNGALAGTGLIIGENSQTHYGIKLDTLRIMQCGTVGVQLNKISDSTINQVSVTSCTNTLTTSDRTTYGLALTTCSNLAISNCRCSDLPGTASGAYNSSTYGIYINGSTNVTCTDCATDSNSSSVASGGTATTAGIYINNSTAITCQQCVAQNNSATYSTTGTVVAYGFACVTSTRSLLQACTGLGQSNSISDAIGIYVAADSQYIVLDRCSCLGQTGLNAYGIYFGNSSTNTGPLNCIVQNCQMYDNVGSVSGKSFGFKDFASATVASTTTLSHNVAGGHGAINPNSGNVAPTDSNRCNFYVLYSQVAGEEHPSNQLFLEGNFASMGAINTSTTPGNLGQFQNLSIIS